jgi:hypothetical protein
MCKKPSYSVLAGMAAAFFLLGPVVLSAQSTEPSIFAAILVKGQDVSKLQLFSENNPVTYSIFYGQKSGKTYFIKTEDLFSPEKLVHQFGNGVVVSGATAFGLLFNVMTGLDMLGEELLEPIGTLAWADRAATGNSEMPYLISGAFFPKDEKANQIFQTLVMRKATRVK